MKLFKWLFHCICPVCHILQTAFNWYFHSWYSWFIVCFKMITAICCWHKMNYHDFIKSWYCIYKFSFFFFKCLVLRQLWSYSSKKLQENILYLISSLSQKLLWAKLDWIGLKWLLRSPVICCSFCILLLESQGQFCFNCL